MRTATQSQFRKTSQRCPLNSATSDYLGDIDQPNTLSRILLQNIEDLAGAPPVIRIGGHTQDVASFCADCPQTLNNTFAIGNDEAISVIFNKDLFAVLNENVPAQQEFIFGLNFGRNDVSIPLAEVEAAEKYMYPSRLRAYELGNEPDFYGPLQRTRPWNVDKYVAEQEDWLNQLAKKTTKGFSIGALAQLPIYQGNFSLAEITTLGLPEKINYAVSLSDHAYPYSRCDPAREAQVSLPGLMNHTALVEYFSQWVPEIQAATTAGLPFLMGETGSVSCHGTQGVSNTLGAALWELDYMLHGASIGMSGVYFHMGTPFYYSMWQPVPHNGTAATVYPTYYSLLFIAEALTLSHPHIVSIPVGDPTLAVYALYNGSPSDSMRPERLVILNMGFLESSTGDRVAPRSLIDVSHLLGERTKIKRLSGPGSDATSGTTFAGQSYDMGRPTGRKVVERSGGIVAVRSSEAVLVEKY
ncbi:glycoside hydrolase superfamily [Aspergillus floccosus]